MKKEKTIPPQLPFRILRWYCHPQLLERIEGDLIELYEERVRQVGRRKANHFLYLEVLLLFRRKIIRPMEGHQRINTYGMYKNYFTMAWRTIVKNKGYSFINISGLAIGIAACLLIGLFVAHEWQYDRHYADAERIYRVVGVNNEQGERKRGTPFPAPLAAAIKDDYPEVELTGRYLSSELFGAGNNEVRPVTQSENAYDEGFAYVDQEWVDLFQFPFVHGNASEALTKPKALVITQSRAQKYFGGENPIGQLMVINNNDKNPYVITGVIEDFKSTSHVQFNFLMSTKDLEFWKGEQKDWGASNYTVYIKLKPGTDAISFQQKMSKGVIDQYFLPMLLQSGMTVEQTKKLFENAWIELQPLTDIHLYSSDMDDGLPKGDIRLIGLFSGIAVFILMIAAINFINLATSRSANRAREVGIRKVTGSYRSHLVLQFLFESVLLSVVALVIGATLANLALPYFNQLSGKTMSMPWLQPWFLPGLMAVALLVGVIAGVYPAFYLSSFQPIQVLKGSTLRGHGGSRLRSALVIFQFTISTVLIVGTIVIYRQMNFVLNKKIGFNKDQVVMIEGAGMLNNQQPAFKAELAKLPQVRSVSVSDYLPVNGTLRNGNSFWHEGKVNTERAIIAQVWRTDADYLETLGMTIKQGRNFKTDLASDSSSIIINEAMNKEMGGDLIGKRISNGQLYTVIGVVEDFHFESLRQRIEPLCLVLGGGANTISVKADTEDMPSLLEALQTTWKRFLPHQPLRYSFLDDRYAIMYADVQRTGKIFTCFAVLAIAVACLGLFALSAFMIEQRTKEIGIRLVLGASVTSVFRMLTFHFVILVVASLIIAIPLSWYLMNRWLEEFAYRIPITADFFLLAGVAAILISFGTISYQSWRAGRMNPVKSLRSE